MTGKQTCKSVLFDGIKNNSDFYFDHSYFLETINKECVIATTEYHFDFVSAINFKNIYDVLSKHFRLGRVRVLKLNSRSCLSYHRDPENRLHIPIITNPGALMIVEKEAHHMKADGSVYYMYTQRYHTALNGGDEPRVHLVATILDENPEDELYAIYGGD